MNIEVKEFFEKNGPATRGYVTVMYGEMQLYLKVKQYKNLKLFIEIPRLFNNNQSIHAMKWPTKAISDKFQAEVLRQIEQKWPDKLTIKEVVEK